MRYRRHLIRNWHAITRVYAFNELVLCIVSLDLCINIAFIPQKKLRTTNKYSFQSCMTECTVDTILNKCDCLPFYYPESSMCSLWSPLHENKNKNKNWTNNKWMLMIDGFLRFASRYESLFKEIPTVFIAWCEMLTRQSSYVYEPKCTELFSVWICNFNQTQNTVIPDVFSSLKPPDNIAALNESSIGMECVCPPTCSELVNFNSITDTFTNTNKIVVIFHMFYFYIQMLAIWSTSNFIETI